MKKERQKRILEIITSDNVNTQEELIVRLKKFGIEAKQATVSRDIRELHITKVLSKDGTYHYSSPFSRTSGTEKFTLLFSEAVQNISSIQSFVVLQCRASMAQAVSAGIKQLNLEGVAAVIGSDDTILTLCKDDVRARMVERRLKQLLHL